MSRDPPPPVGTLGAPQIASYDSRCPKCRSLSQLYLERDLNNELTMSDLPRFCQQHQNCIFDIALSNERFEQQRSSYLPSYRDITSGQLGLPAIYQPSINVTTVCPRPYQITTLAPQGYYHVLTITPPSYEITTVTPPLLKVASGNTSILPMHQETRGMENTQTGVEAEPGRPWPRPMGQFNSQDPLEAPSRINPPVASWPQNYHLNMHANEPPDISSQQHAFGEPERASAFSAFAQTAKRTWSPMMERPVEVGYRRPVSHQPQWSASSSRPDLSIQDPGVDRPMEVMSHRRRPHRDQYEPRNTMASIPPIRPSSLGEYGQFPFEASRYIVPHGTNTPRDQKQAMPAFEPTDLSYMQHQNKRASTPFGDTRPIESSWNPFMVGPLEFGDCQRPVWHQPQQRSSGPLADSPMEIERSRRPVWKQQSCPAITPPALSLQGSEEKRPVEFTSHQRPFMHQSERGEAKKGPGLGKYIQVPYQYPNEASAPQEQPLTIPTFKPGGLDNMQFKSKKAPAPQQVCCGTTNPSVGARPVEIKGSRLPLWIYHNTAPALPSDVQPNNFQNPVVDKTVKVGTSRLAIDNQNPLKDKSVELWSSRLEQLVNVPAFVPRGLSNKQIKPKEDPVPLVDTQDPVVDRPVEVKGCGQPLSPITKKASTLLTDTQNSNPTKSINKNTQDSMVAIKYNSVKLGDYRLPLEVIQEMASDSDDQPENITQDPVVDKPVASDQNPVVDKPVEVGVCHSSVQVISDPEMGSVLEGASASLADTRTINNVQVPVLDRPPIVRRGRRTFWFIMELQALALALSTNIQPAIESDNTEEISVAPDEAQTAVCEHQ